LQLNAHPDSSPSCVLKIKSDKELTRPTPPRVTANALASARERAVLDHEAAILHDLYPRARELFGNRVVAYAGLHPDRLRARGEYVFQMRGHVPRASEDVHHVNPSGHVREPSVDPAPEDLRRLRVVDRHSPYVEARGRHVLRDVEGWLEALRLGLDAEHGHAPGLREQS